MNDLRNYQARVEAAGSRADAGIDEGLRAYMSKVYSLMAFGLALTGIVAYGASVLAIQNGELTAFGQAIYLSPLKYVIMFAPLGIAFFFGARIHAMSVPTAQMTFWIFAGIMGLSLSAIFLIYTGASITKTFAVTAATFGALSLYGYTTRKDLSGWGTFLFMGVIGLIIASIVNFFLASSALDFAISAAGVLIFAGLTAYDTQSIKEMYWEGDDSDVAGRKAIMGALNLYLDFINLFLYLLRFLGDRE